MPPALLIAPESLIFSCSSSYSICSSIEWEYDDEHEHAEKCSSPRYKLAKLPHVQARVVFKGDGAVSRVCVENFAQAGDEGFVSIAAFGGDV